MIGRDFKQQREAVFNLVEESKRLCGGLPDNIGKEGFQKAEENLRNYTFKLFIVGEAKAGKSTLINALTGSDLLPTGALQCSNIIIEIRCSEGPEDCFVDVCYADDNHEQKKFGSPKDDQLEIGKFLRKVASVQQQYNIIPTTTIDSYIVAHKHELDADGKLVLDGGLPINDWFHDSKLPYDDTAKSCVDKYLRERSLGQIPSSITLGIFLGDDIFPGFRIVDSPGIGAVGGVQSVTFKQIKEANAFVFVHSLTEKIESEHFYEFVHEYAMDKRKQQLYLALTKRNNGEPEEDVTSKVETAKLQYRDLFEKSHVFDVDSIAQLTLDDVEKEIDAELLKEKYKSKIEQYEAIDSGNYNVDAEKSLVKRKLRTLEDITLRYSDLTPDQVRNKVKKVANFGGLRKAIDKLVKRSSDILIYQILEMLALGCSEIINQLDEEISLNNSKIKNPKNFEAEIEVRKENLDKYKRDIRRFIDGKKTEYSGKGLIDDKIESLTDDIKKDLEKIANDDDYKMSLEEEMEKIEDPCTPYTVIFFKYQDNLSSLIQDSASNLKRDFMAEQDRLQFQLRESRKTISLPKIDVTSLELNAFEEAYKAAYVTKKPEGLIETIKSWFVELTEFSDEEFHKGMRKKFLDGFEEISDNAKLSMENYLKLFLEPFENKVAQAVDQRMKSIGEIEQSKLNNEQIVKEINEKTQTKEKIQEQQRRLTELMVNLE
ncbi:MAG: dynamin family protein [Aestuariivita sp.]|nr:dynamin family protein [Aestuariivita sp.]